ncbi:hypothetical protein FQN54_009726 [Arachnomyces sp. PD_36]|nr:hypothetical protein FQN54_009726 [Arachnomyces sp. PD_36]
MSSPLSRDLESNNGVNAFLKNSTVRNFSWTDLVVTVKDRETKQPRNLLSNVSGYASQGELVALMGPSGCGKTTLLNALAQRPAATGAKVSGDTLIDGTKIDQELFKRITTYVEQEDSLIGSLTVRETLHFAAQLSLPRTISKKHRIDRINSLLQAFGIHGQAETIVGTPIQKGISGGQKRRVSVASQLITCPKILFLDEPTSGLDSTASFEVMSYVNTLAKENNLIIIASIHQPSTAIFELFDKLLLLSAGKTCYFGPARDTKSYFDGIGCPMPVQINPAEFILDLVSSDFAINRRSADVKLEDIHSAWSSSSEAKVVDSEIRRLNESEEKVGDERLAAENLSGPNPVHVTLSLLHRSWIKSRRDVVAYGIRIIMYLGLAIMSGTVWLRLATTQENIQPFINSLFFGSAFMSFMAVAYVPAFLEDRATFIKERANGLYGATSFIISNFIIGLPFLFIISILFSIVAYWLSNFRPTASAFFIWVMWLFLDLVAAESLVVLASSIFPNFVISLALVAFSNGLWMCVGGFMISPTILNPFWKYVFHYIDYQAYVFQGMMVNEFAGRVFSCDSDCRCMYQTSLADQCQIDGRGVLAAYGYAEHRTGKWVGLILVITFVYRVFGWIAMVLRKT